MGKLVVSQASLSYCFFLLILIILSGGKPMKKLTALTSLIAGAGMMLTISVTQAGTASETIAQAEADIAAANDARAVWRLLDPVSGGKAVPLDKLLKAAKAKLDANEESEAIRIAEKISWAARAGIAQSEAQKDASPVYY